MARIVADAPSALGVPLSVLDLVPVAAGTFCAETDERARELALPAALQFLRLRLGQPGPLPSPRQVADVDWSDGEDRQRPHELLTEAADWPRPGGPRRSGRAGRDVMPA